MASDPTRASDPLSNDSAQRGEAKGKASALLAIFASRGVQPTPTQRQRIEGCADLALLDGWIQAALQGGSIDAVLTGAAAPSATPAGKSKLLFYLLGAGAAAFVLFGVLIAMAFWIARPDSPKLTQGSQRMVSELEGPMTMDVYVTRGLPKLDAFADALAGLTKQYEDASKGKLKVRFINVQTDEQREEAKEQGLQVVAFGEALEGTAESATIMQGVLGIVFKYKAEKDVIPVLAPESTVGVEFWISNKIRELRAKGDGVQLRVGVLTGTGEIALSEQNLVVNSGGGSPSMKSIFTQAMPFYQLETVDLNGGTTEIDPSLEGLIITQPARDLTDDELRRIDQFVMRGKSLVAYVSAGNVAAADVEMKPQLGLHNVDKLLAGYGLTVSPELLVDFEAAVAAPVMTASGSVAKLRSPCIFAINYDEKAPLETQQLDSTFAGFFRLEEIAFPYASSVTLDATKQPNARLRVVARSGANAHPVRADVACKTTTEGKPEGPFAQYAIAAVAEGELHSATQGWAGSAGFEVPATSSTDARVLVVASSHFLTNPFARAGNPPPSTDAMMPAFGGDETLKTIAMPYAQKHLTTTILCFKNTLDWMTGDTDLVEASGTLLIPKEEPGPVKRAARWLTNW